MNDLLIPKFKMDFDLTQMQANLIQSAFFGAFFFVSLFYFIISSVSGDPINKIGYKNALVGGLVICCGGCLLFYPAAIYHEYALFLFALLTLGAGVTIIQIAANPYVAILGDPSSANSRLNLSQGINSLGYVIAPVIGGLLLFGNDVFQSSGGVDAVKNTYIGLGVCFLVLAVIVKTLKLPEFKATEAKTSFNIFEDKKFLLGMVAIFFYVGSEVTVGSILINYLGEKDVLGIAAHHADKYLSFYWGGLMIGRLVGSVSMSSMQGSKKMISMLLIASVATLIIFSTASFKNFMTSGHHINPIDIMPFLGIIALSFVFFCLGGKNSGRTVGLFSLVAVVLIMIAIKGSGTVALWSIIGVGLFNSIMWSNIFTLSIESMGEKTSKASSLLVMMIVGGAIIPVIQGALADSFGIRNSLYVVIIGYLYLAFFGLIGSKKDA
jgi:FHS family L-fucose permease-like MFS transporter